MSISIGKYTIKAMDEFNFALYETREKGTFRGKKGEGTTESLVGYYGYLNMAMSKIVNLESLKAISSSDEYLDAKSILEAFNTIETKLYDAYHIKPDVVKE